MGSESLTGKPAGNNVNHGPKSHTGFLLTQPIFSEVLKRRFLPKLLAFSDSELNIVVDCFSSIKGVTLALALRFIA
jgi:hypothetical protein